MSIVWYCRAQISEAGLSLFAVCYGGNAGDSVNHLCYEKYMDIITTSTSKVEPQRLPPTERAAYFHCLRVHYQVRVRKAFDECVQNLEEWGCKKVNNLLLPAMTDKEVPPENLQIII